MTNEIDEDESFERDVAKTLALQNIAMQLKRIADVLENEYESPPEKHPEWNIFDKERRDKQ